MIDEVQSEVAGKAGRITLNRARALNALSLPMVRALTEVLRRWQEDPAIEVVAIRGMGKAGPFGAFCAGGDIRFFHQAALAGDDALADFFTEEYALNHLVHHYSKPYVAFLDGIVMGGGMGLCQGARSRIVTERTKMAMPETNIGLFPDVGGGWFLSRCPGHLGEYLALTGEVIGAADAIHAGLADVTLSSTVLPDLWDALPAAGATALPAARSQPDSALAGVQPQIDRHFSQGSVTAILASLEADGSDWALRTVATLRQRSPLMLHVTLEQVRRARSMTLADDLRMERDLVHHCFHLRPGTASETVEGIRALAVDKDHAPRWNPARVEDVTQAMVDDFFSSPWSAEAHPLRALD